MYWPHPVVVGISTNLFVGRGVWYARVNPRRKSAILGAVSCVHCASFAFLFPVYIVGVSKVSFIL